MSFMNSHGNASAAHGRLIGDEEENAKVLARNNRLSRNCQAWFPDGLNPQVLKTGLGSKRNMVRRAYNHAEYLDERRQLMQWWSDYLDRCAVKAEK